MAMVIGIGHPIRQNDRLVQRYAPRPARPGPAGPRPAIPQKPHFQISNVQHGLEQQYYRVEVLEKALAYREMSVDEREAMEAELDAIKKLLITNEKSLRKLQSENRQTVSVAGLFIFLCVAVFLIYTVLTNTN